MEKLYYDDEYEEERQMQVPEMRVRMDETNAGAPESVSRMQTDAVGSNQPMERKPGRAGPQGYVYLIETGDKKFVKIGYSSRPLRRANQIGLLLPSCYGVRLIASIPGTYETETALHRRFRDCWDHGEWFHRNSDIDALIADILAGNPPAEPQQTAPDPPRQTRIANGPKSAAAIALAEMRMKRMSAAERSEIARMGGEATREKLTPEQRSEIARNAGLAGGRGRPKKQSAAGRRKPPATAKRPKPR